MKTFLIVILSIGILLQFYFGHKEITKWRELASENHISYYNCIGQKVDYAEQLKKLTGKIDSLKEVIDTASTIVKLRKALEVQEWEDDTDEESTNVSLASYSDFDCVFRESEDPMSSVYKIYLCNEKRWSGEPRQGGITTVYKKRKCLFNRGKRESEIYQTTKEHSNGRSSIESSVWFGDSLVYSHSYYPKNKLTDDAIEAEYSQANKARLLYIKTGTCQ